MKSRKFLAGFLGAVIVCSQGQNFIPSAIAADYSAMPKNTSSKKLSPVAITGIILGGGIPAVGLLAAGLWLYNSNQSKENSRKLFDERAEFLKQPHNSDKDTVLEDYSVYDRTQSECTRVETFFEDMKLRFNDINSTIQLRVPGGFLKVFDQLTTQWVKSQELCGIKNHNRIADRIYIQVGKTAQENISYRILHGLLWGDKNYRQNSVGEFSPLVKFLEKHKDEIDQRFIKVLNKYGYTKAVEEVYGIMSPSESGDEGEGVYGSGSEGGEGGSSTFISPAAAPAIAGNINLGYGTLKYTPAPTMPDRAPVLNSGSLNPADGSPTLTIDNGKFRRTEPYRRVTFQDTGCSSVVPMGNAWKNDARWLAFVNDEMLDRAINEHVPLFTGFYDFQNGDVKKLKAKSGAGTGTGFYKLASEIADECGKSYPANVAEILEYGESIGCRKMGFVDPANMVFPCGAVTVSKTLEETAGTQSTMVAAMNSNMMADFYGNAKSRDIWERFGVITGVRFYRSRNLVSGVTGKYGDRQGLNPAWLDPQYQAKTLLSDENSIETTVVVTGFDKGRTLDKFEICRWARSMAIIVNALGIKFFVLAMGGTASFGAVDASIYAPGGIVAREFEDYAPNTKVVVFDQSKRSGNGMAAYKVGIKGWAQVNRPSLLQYLN